jgi:diguanylate cyclase (GGDEF)-like protein
MTTDSNLQLSSGHRRDSFLADKKILKQVLNALDKLLYFDTTLIFDTYIHALLSEVESAKNKVQSYAQELEAKVAERTQQLQDLSQHDPLTGLLNRRALNDDLRRQLAMAKRQNKSFTLVYLDVDDFKQINDSRGHFGGDEVLKQVATALKSVCREVDIPCRYGGDEFCLILPDSNLEEAKIACQRLEDYFAINVKGVTLSIGIAMSGPSEHVTPDELLRAADKKMYEAKAQNGFAICI